MTNPTTQDLLAILRANPHPKQTYLKRKDHVAYININGREISYDGQWCSDRVGFTDTQFTSLDPKDVHAEIDRVLNIAKQTHTETQTMTAKQLSDILSNHPYPGATNLTGDYDGLMGFNVGGFGVVYDRGMWGVYLADTEYPITPNFPPFGELTVRDVHAEISRVVKIGKGLHANTRSVATETVSTEQTFVSIDRYRELEAELKTVTKDRDTYKARQEYTQEILNQIWDATGWPEKFDEPDAIEYIKRLKSKAGLLSVICRRLCGDENASIETVHKALDLFDDQRNALDYITQKVQCDSDPTLPHGLQALGHTVAQLVKSLGDKTVEVAKLQEGIKNYEAQLKGYAANKRLQEFARIQTILNNAGVATVYDDEADRSVPTDERVRILCERLKENVVARRDDGAKMHQLSDEIRQAHLTLNDLNAARCMGTIDLSLSARIRSVFTTKV